MYKKVLFAYDPEGLADRAVPAIEAIVAGSGAEVLVVTVRDDMREFEPAAALERRARAAVASLREGGIDARGEMLRVYSDSTSHALLDRARQYRPDLVVLGSHGRGDLAGLLLGSVAHRVAAGLTCQVMIVRGGDDHPLMDIRRVLVSIDPSSESMAAIRTARQVARDHNAGVRVLHVREFVRFSDGVTAVETPLASSSLTQQATRLLSEGGVSATTKVVDGPIASEIVKQADEFDADLIILGSRRHGSAGSLLLGSVAHGVIARTHRPVLLAEKGDGSEQASSSGAAVDEHAS